MASNVARLQSRSQVRSEVYLQSFAIEIGELRSGAFLMERCCQDLIQILQGYGMVNHWCENFSNFSHDQIKTSDCVFHNDLKYCLHICRKLAVRHIEAEPACHRKALPKRAIPSGVWGQEFNFQGEVIVCHSELTGNAKHFTTACVEMLLILPTSDCP